MTKIDNPFEAELSDLEKGESSGANTARMAIQVLGGFLPLAALFGRVWGFASDRAQKERYLRYLRALRDQLNRLSNKNEDLEKRLSDLGSTVEFQNAAYAGVQESIRTSDDRKADRLGVALANSLIVLSGAEDYVAGELETMIRELAQLSEMDLRALRILGSVFSGVVKTTPNLNHPDSFTEQFESYRKVIEANKIHPDDFYSQCCRLTGFGLAMEALRNPSRMPPDAHLYRPTLRGVRLLRLIAANPEEPL